MRQKRLHIISFDNPFPPDYGGVIDVFFKLKAFYRLGYKIHLHCFVKEDEAIPPELAAITEKVFFYKSDRSIRNFFSLRPFAVQSRFHKDLITNINAFDAPVFFEGLQTTMALHKMQFGNTKLYLRLHNIESAYFFGTAKSEQNWFRKFLYFSESVKYKHYQKILSRFDTVFTLSWHEQHLMKDFDAIAQYVPVFHGNSEVRPLSGFGEYALYHGDLRLADNKKAAAFLIDVFKEIPDYKLIIASGCGKDFVSSRIGNLSNVEFVDLQNQDHLESLLEKAHMSVMLSFQQSGTKLKLINSLYHSRHCVINENMVDDDRILSLCEMAHTKAQFIETINSLRNVPYYSDHRKQLLSAILDDNITIREIDRVINETFTGIFF